MRLFRMRRGLWHWWIRGGSMTRSREPRARLWLVLCGVVGLAACWGGDSNDEDRRCEELVDHMVDLQLGEDDPTDPAQAAELEKHRASLRGAIGKRVLADCRSRPSAHQECLLRAANAAEIKECN